ncbi:PAS domain-containing hybrid sensor histidine kinase/response regulator [Rhodopirellula baltica]|uniref:Sensory/regulatory protein RpfC n=1 Tax=Rhodopirellula baltica WH47 TaxID=991778 RepID=F2B144_RHOBT|nr:PAS domain S-box protein [Rhodopirellula baltica]EGF24396.1 sensory transduction histidine kinase [Rhodopirellula baltica WH47]
MQHHSQIGDDEDILVTLSEITELRRSRELFQLLVDASAQIVWMTDADGNVTEDSPSWRAFTGQEIDQMMGIGWTNAVHADDRSPALEAWKLAVQNVEDFVAEYRLRHHLGHYVRMQVSGVAQRRSDGSIDRWGGMNIDISEWKQREAESEYREHHLRDVIDSTGNFIAVLDLDGTMLEVNELALVTGGVSREDVIGKPFWECVWWNFDPKVRHQIHEYCQRVAAGESIRCDTPCWSVADGARPVDLSFRPIRDTDGNVTHLVPSGVDILDRQTAVDELRRSDELVRTIAENSTQALVMMDDRGYVTYSNNAFLKMTGFDDTEIRSRPLHDLIHHHYPDGRPYPMAECPIDRALPEDFTVRAHEDLFFRKDGSTFEVLCEASPVFQDGKPVSTVIEVSDVTDLKLSELKIRLSAERLAVAADVAGLGILHVDLMSQSVTYSAEMKRILGWDDDSAVPSQSAGTPDFVHIDDRERYACHYETMLSANFAKSRSIDYRIVRPDAKVRWVRLQTKTLIDEQTGKPDQLVGTMLDITRQRKFEMDLKAARDAAQFASQSKSKFLANMSHEIRTPMTAILGYAELLGEHDLPAEACDFLKTIRRNGDYLLDIIDEILDLSKIEADKLEMNHELFDLMRVVEDVRSIMDVRASEKDLQIRVCYDGKLPRRIQSDPKRLKQILINLVGNAIKFTRQGHVDLAVRYVDGHLQFDITDSGIGMSDDQKAKLFQPFSQGDSSVSRDFGGTGLGLAISRRLAKMLGGEIYVQSQLRQGSTFTATIQIGSVNNVEFMEFNSGVDVQPTASSDSLATTQPIKLACRVLVVDDRRDIRFLSKRILTNAGASVDEAEDGKLGLDFVREQLAKDKPPDLILLDMQMPNMDGYETAEKLRTAGYTGPIIALTADAMQGNMTRCLEAGCNNFLSKPIDAVRLVQLVWELTAAMR